MQPSSVAMAILEAMCQDDGATEWKQPGSLSQQSKVMLGKVQTAFSPYNPNEGTLLVQSFPMMTLGLVMRLDLANKVSVNMMQGLIHVCTVKLILLKHMLSETSCRAIRKPKLATQRSHRENRGDPPAAKTETTDMFPLGHLSQPSRHETPQLKLQTLCSTDEPSSVS